MIVTRHNWEGNSPCLFLAQCIIHRLHVQVFSWNESITLILTRGAHWWVLVHTHTYSHTSYLYTHLHTHIHSHYLSTHLHTHIRGEYLYSRVPGHRNHRNDPASVFLSTYWWSQHPACQRWLFLVVSCFCKPLRNCHPRQRVSKKKNLFWNFTLDFMLIFKRFLSFYEILCWFFTRLYVF